jgi:hypothetical protein
VIVRFLVAFSGFANDTAWFLFGALLLGVVLVEPYTLEADRERKKDVQAAANAIGQQLIVVEVGSDRDFETAFATFAQRGADALFGGTDAFLNSLQPLCGRGAPETR